MYGDTGTAMRHELAALLRQHRIQQRLGGTGQERAAVGLQIRQYRLRILLWCTQALEAVSPLTFSNQHPAQPNPFRSAGTGPGGGSPASELARALHYAVSNATTVPAAIDQIVSTSNQASDRPVLEHWRLAARAAVLAEHDTAPDVTSAMSVRQAQVVVGDVAAITQAIVILDQRYRTTPGWQVLAKSDRLGWAALAAALDVNLGQPDYTVDDLGWRPSTKLIKGPAKPGILGVLQAEHNLVIRMKTFPTATNLRYVIDSQRLLSRRLVPYAERIDPRTAERWNARADTYAHLQRQFRRIGGLAGKGGHAAAEGATVVSRIRALPADAIVEPRVLGGFQVLFERLDKRIADVIEDGIDRQMFFQRVPLPRLVGGTGSLVAPVRERFMPVDRTTHVELIDTIRNNLASQRHVGGRSPGPARADLHAALIHRAGTRDIHAGPSL